MEPKRGRRLVQRILHGDEQYCWEATRLKRHVLKALIHQQHHQLSSSMEWEHTPPTSHVNAASTKEATGLSAVNTSLGDDLSERTNRSSSFWIIVQTRTATGACGHDTSTR